MQPRHDVVIIGAGPAGTATALGLRQHGISTLIVEKEPFPRYHIGESLTTEAGEYLRDAGLTSIVRDAPVKRGVKVYGRDGQNSFYVPVAARTTAGLTPSTTWQVRRSAFDARLLDAARAQGAERMLGEALAPLVEDGRVTGVRVHSGDREHTLRAAVVVDASGQSTFLSRHRVAGAKQRGRYANQTAVFSQVRNTVREAPHQDDTFIFYAGKHHWAWFIPLDAQVVSVGVVVPVAYLQDMRARDGSLEAFLARELRALNPELCRRVPDTTFVEPVRTISNYSYDVTPFAGPGYLCVGDSHRFIDPIFSFGVTLGLREGELAARAIHAHLGGHASAPESSPGDPAFAAYQARANRGQDLLNDMIDFFWARPLYFALLVHGEHQEEFIDYFAGRVYDDGERAGLQEMRRVLARARQRRAHEREEDTP